MELEAQMSGNLLLSNNSNNLEYIWTVDKHRSEEYSEAHNTFLEARKLLPSIDLPKSLAMEYGDRFVEFDATKQNIIPAEPVRLAKKDRYQDAIKYIKQSETISQHILAQHLQEVEREAKKVREKIREVVREDPDNALEDFLSELDEVLDYAERFHPASASLPQHPLAMIEVSRIAEAAEIVDTAELNVELTQFLNRTVETDFDKGQYELSSLSQDGKNSIKEFIEQLVDLKKSHGEKSLQQTIIIKIKIVGYTDQVGFRAGTDLVKELSEGVEDEVPQYQPERRQFLNQRLSFFRARTIGGYVQQLLAELDQESLEVQIEPEIEGKGEEVPPGVTPPYPRADSRRRICKISATLRSKETRP